MPLVLLSTTFPRPPAPDYLSFGDNLPKQTIERNSQDYPDNYTDYPANYNDSPHLRHGNS
jgi:hypothetical protein